MTAGPLQINTNPRNGKPAFNTSLFSVETLGQLGNASRRFFHGPGISNFDMQIKKTVRLTESKSMDFRVQAFNVFNHAQFYGPAAVNGVVNDPELWKGRKRGRSAVEFNWRPNSTSSLCVR